VFWIFYETTFEEYLYNEQRCLNFGWWKEMHRFEFTITRNRDVLYFDVEKCFRFTLQKNTSLLEIHLNWLTTKCFIEESVFEDPEFNSDVIN